jgi:hypothetical protein
VLHDAKSRHGMPFAELIQRFVRPARKGPVKYKLPCNLTIAHLVACDWNQQVPRPLHAFFAQTYSYSGIPQLRVEGPGQYTGCIQDTDTGVMATVQAHYGSGASDLAGSAGRELVSLPRTGGGSSRGAPALTYEARPPDTSRHEH